PVDGPLDVNSRRNASSVARWRKRAREDPRSAIAWSELARSYLALGLMRHAERALTIGLSLAPNHRYLIRNSVCFFISVNQLERAHLLVSRAEATSGDPWLIATELAAAHVAGEPPRFARQAKGIVESGNVASSEISEIASELGTMELSHRRKEALRLFEKAL